MHACPHRGLVAQSLGKQVEAGSVHASDDLGKGLGVPVGEGGLVVGELRKTVFRQLSFSKIVWFSSLDIDLRLIMPTGS
jgi:hypothetical protein